MKKNLDDQHSQDRQRIEEEIDNLQYELRDAQDNYNRASARKRKVDREIGKLDVDCCGL